MSSSLDDVPLMAWSDRNYEGCEVSASTREDESTFEEKSEMILEEGEGIWRHDDVVQSTCSADDMTVEMESTVDEVPIDLGEEDAVTISSDESATDRAIDAPSSLQSSVQGTTVHPSEPSSVNGVASEVASCGHAENESLQDGGNKDTSSVPMRDLAEQILETEDDAIEVRARLHHNDAGEAAAPVTDVENEAIDASCVQESLPGIAFDLSIGPVQQHQATEALSVSDAEDARLQNANKDENISARTVGGSPPEQMTETEYAIEIQAYTDREETTDESPCDGSLADGPIEWSKPQEQSCTTPEAQFCSRAENGNLRNREDDDKTSGEMIGVVEEIPPERKECVTEDQSHAESEDDTETADRKMKIGEDVTDGPAIPTLQDRALVPLSTTFVLQRAVSETQSSNHAEDASSQNEDNDGNASPLMLGPAKQIPQGEDDAIEARTYSAEEEETKASDPITNVEDVTASETSSSLHVSLDVTASDVNHSSTHQHVVSDAASSNDAEDVCFQKEDDDQETAALATGLAKQTSENEECVTEVRDDAEAADTDNDGTNEGLEVYASPEVTALDSTKSSIQQCAASEAPSSTQTEDEPLQNQDNNNDSSKEMMDVAEQTLDDKECVTEAQDCPQQEEDVGSVGSLEHAENDVTDEPLANVLMDKDSVDLSHLSAEQNPALETNSVNHAEKESLQDESNDERTSPPMTDPAEQIPETEDDAIEVQTYPHQEEQAEGAGFVEDIEEEATDASSVHHSLPGTTVDLSKQQTQNSHASEAEFFSDSDDQQEHLVEEELNIKRDRWLDTLACVERAEKSESEHEQTEQAEIEKSEEKELHPFTPEEDNSPLPGALDRHSKEHEGSDMDTNAKAPDEADANRIDAVVGKDAEEDLPIEKPTIRASHLPAQQEETEKEEVPEAVSDHASLEKTHQV